MSQTSVPTRYRSTTAVVVLGALWLAVAVGGLVLSAANASAGTSFGDTVFSTAISFAFAAVAGLIASRTGHRIGWLLFAIAIAFTAGAAAEQYVLYGVVTKPDSLPGTTAVALGVGWIYAVLTTSLVLLLLTFPTGSVRSKRWRPLLIALPIATFLYTVPFMLREIHGPWDDRGVHLTNPIGVGPPKGFVPIFAVGILASLGLGVAGVVSLVLRFRSSHGVERQQVKWLAYFGVVAGVLLLTSLGTAVVLGPGPECHSSFCGPRDIPWLAFFTTFMLGTPIAVGAAILRYRLYDIDRIISRTLSYTAVTALLGGLFAIVVLVPSAVVGSRGTKAPSWLVAVATLVVFGLFRPVLRRVRSVVDHRFNRRRYNAEHTIEAFTARLREQVDIDALGAELKEIVGRTMQPDRVSLWVRKDS